MPQKYRMDYHDVLETDIVLLLIKFERLMGEGRLGFAELLGGEAGVLLEVAAEECDVAEVVVPRQFLD